MDLTTCTVRARVYKQDGTPDVGASVIAKLNRFDIDEGHVGPYETIATVDEAGEAILTLWPNSRGSTESVYRIKIEGSDKTLSIYAVVPDIASVDLEDIATLPAYEGKPDGAGAISLILEQLEIVAAQVVAAAASAVTAASEADAAEASAGVSAAQAVIATTQAGIATTQAGLADASADAAAVSQGIALASLVTVSASPPASPLANTEWIDSDTGKHYTWLLDSDGYQWVETFVAQVVDNPTLVGELRDDLENSDGSTRVGHGASTVGAVLDVLNAFYIAHDGNHTAAILAAVAAIPNAGSGVIRFAPGVDYQITDQINIINKRVIIDGNNATLTLIASDDYALYIEGENCELRNFSLNKTEGVTSIAGVFLKGLQHVVKNVTSRDQKWDAFIHAQDLKESKFSDLDVQLDVSGRTGDIFVMDYCVNNDMSNNFFGYCDSMIRGTALVHPVSGYSNEGLGLSHIKCVFARKPIDFVRMTALAVESTCVFDFCEDWGIFITHGHTLDVAGWFASNGAAEFIGVGTGPTFDNARVTRVMFAKNGGGDAIAVSLPGTNSAVTNIRCIGGMDAGVVTQPATPMSLLANSVEASGLPFTNESCQEGTWTPVVSFGGATTGIAYSSRPARYVKTGNRVDVSFYIALSSKGSSVGGAVVSGLPFVASATASLYVGAGGYLNGVVAAGPLAAYLTPDTANVTLGFAGATGFTQLADTHFTNATEVSMSFSYTIDE